MIKKYLKDHSLTPAHVKKLGWVWEEGGDTITIPIYDKDANLLYSRYRHLTGENKFSTDPGSHPTLYCSHRIAKKDFIVLCEGEPDAARLWQEGIAAVTGTSGVKAFSKALAMPLKGKNVSICLDNDEGGQSSIEQYFKILLEVGAKPQITDLPKKYKDVCEYFAAKNTGKDFQDLDTYSSLEQWRDANLPLEYSWENADDILATDLPDEKWLVDKIIPTEGFTFFVGPEASAKSFYSLILAKCVTTGKPWLERFKVPKKTNVLIIDKENTKRRTQDRLRGLKIKGNKIHWLAYPQYLEIADRSKESETGYTKFVEAISRQVKRDKIGLIVLDSFTDIFVGEENDRGDIQQFFDAFRQLFPGTAILALHHAGKITMGAKRPTSQMARGSSNIMAQAYTAFHTEPVRKKISEFIIEQTKAGDSLKMSKFKVGSVTIPDPLHPEETLVTGFDYLGEVQDREEKLADGIDAFAAILGSTPRMPRKELAEQLELQGVSSATFGRVLKQFKEEGRVRMEKSLTVARGQDVVWIKEVGEDFYE